MRPTPYDTVFGPGAEPRFERIRDSLAAASRDPHDADAFVLDREAGALLRELVPEEGVGAALAEHLALLHHAYLYWAEGGWLIRLAREEARRLLGPDRPPAEAPAAETPRAFYVQFPERLVWAELGPGEPHQPLDGLFVRPWPGGGCFVLGVFGLHPAREGFSVVEADGYAEGPPEREHGGVPFSPVLPGGEAAGLHSLVGEGELLELGVRAAACAAHLAASTAGSHRPHQPVEAGTP